jgi:hypothetical protein
MSGGTEGVLSPHGLRTRRIPLIEHETRYFAAGSQ